MPIRVHCPTGCLVNMPSNRAGKIVRCPECKSTIELPTISESERMSGKPIPCEATLVAAEKRLETIVAAESGATVAARLAVPHELSPLGIKEFAARRKAELKQLLATIEPIVVTTPGPSVSSNGSGSTQRTSSKKKSQPMQVRRVKPPAVPDFFLELDAQAEFRDDEPPFGWQQRIQQANADRALLARLFSMALCLLAVVHVIPAIMYGAEAIQSSAFNSMPRWFYLVFFVAATHLIYALFLFQIPDWSALRAVSVAMLGVAFAFGLLATSLLIGGGQSLTATFLGLSHGMVPRAEIWSVAMLCLATLLAYGGGREANQWQRAEQLLAEILGKVSSDAQPNISR